MRAPPAPGPGAGTPLPSPHAVAQPVSQRVWGQAAAPAPGAQLGQPQARLTPRTSPRSLWAPGAGAVSAEDQKGMARQRVAAPPSWGPQAQPQLFAGARGLSAASTPFKPPGTPSVPMHPHGPLAQQQMAQQQFGYSTPQHHMGMQPGMQPGMQHFASAPMAMPPGVQLVTPPGSLRLPQPGSLQPPGMTPAPTQASERPGDGQEQEPQLLEPIVEDDLLEEIEELKSAKAKGKKKRSGISTPAQVWEIGPDPRARTSWFCCV